MFATEFARACRYVVGVGIKDTEGTKHALRKAIGMASSADTIVAIHIPQLVPDMLLSSVGAGRGK